MQPRDRPPSRGSLVLETSRTAADTVRHSTWSESVAGSSFLRRRCVSLAQEGGSAASNPSCLRAGTLDAMAPRGRAGLRRRSPARPLAAERRCAKRLFARFCGAEPRRAALLLLLDCLFNSSPARPHACARPPSWSERMPCSHKENASHYYDNF